MTEYRTIRPGEEDAFLTLWTGVFGVGHEYFERYFDGDPAWRPQYTHGCWEHGRLVSAVQIVRRDLRLNGHIVPMGGIANVATYPEYRKKGHSTRLLREAIRVMDEEDFLFSMLFTGIHGFYARLGWHPTADGAWIGTPVPVSLEGWRFRLVQPNEMDLLVDWYASFNARHPLSVVRSKDHWRGWNRWGDSRWQQDWYVGEYKGQPRGYVWLGQQESDSKQIVQVKEVGCESHDQDALKALLGFAVETARHASAETVVVRLPINGYEGILRSVIENVRWFQRGDVMVRSQGEGKTRLLNAFRLLDSFILEDEIPDDPAVALRLLFGAYFGSLPGASENLQHRFPPRPAIYWEGDGF